MAVDHVVSVLKQRAKMISTTEEIAQVHARWTGRSMHLMLPYVHTCTTCALCMCTVHVSTYMHAYVWGIGVD